MSLYCILRCLNKKRECKTLPKAKYDIIYHDLKQKIEDETYAYQDLLPSEHLLVQTYDCSRNTVRRALAELTAEGYVQPMHGKGVRNIFQPVDQAAFTVGGIESFLESAIRNKKVPFTKVLHFSQLSADEKISKKTGFPFGTKLYYIQRLRYLDGIPLILDHNYFSMEQVRDLTPEIARNSVYEDLKDYTCLAVITNQTFDDNGIQFEYTQSRHRPDYFQFQDIAVRKKK